MGRAHDCLDFILCESTVCSPHGKPRAVQRRVLVGGGGGESPWTLWLGRYAIQYVEVGPTTRFGIRAKGLPSSSSSRLCLSPRHHVQMIRTRTQQHPPSSRKPGPVVSPLRHRVRPISPLALPSPLHTRPCFARLLHPCNPHPPLGAPALALLFQQLPPAA